MVSARARPAWFVILLGIAFVFGVYYLWQGLRNFMATGLSVAESTQQAVVASTATSVRQHEIAANAPTPLPTFTPIPPCQEFIVRVPEAIVRAEPSTNSAIVKALREGETVCVIDKAPDPDWYIIDENTLTRRLERVYMHQDIIRALHPTATFTNTFTPSPTLTATRRPSATPMPTNPPVTATSPPRQPSPSPTATASPNAPSVNL